MSVNLLCPNWAISEILKAGNKVTDWQGQKLKKSKWKKCLKLKKLAKVNSEKSRFKFYE